MSVIQYDCFSRDEPETERAEMIVKAFENHNNEISTIKDKKGLGSDDVLDSICPELENLGFNIEKSKKSEDRIPLTASSKADQLSTYHVDGYHQEWGFVLEVEGGRRDALYKDVFKALVLEEASTLVLAVPVQYDYGDKTAQSDDRYSLAQREVGAIHATDRFDLPCDIIVIGY